MDRGRAFVVELREALAKLVLEGGGPCEAGKDGVGKRPGLQ